MINVLGIIGAGVLGQHIAHYAKLTGDYTDFVFFDDTIEIGTIADKGMVVGSLNDIPHHINTEKIQGLLVGIGYNHLHIRELLFIKYHKAIHFPNIIHQSCYVDQSVLMGQGNVLLPGCILDKGCVVGNNNFFNPGIVMAHDNQLGNHNFLAPGVKFSGFVNTGNKCFIGTGSTIIDNLQIVDNVKVGAGSVITKNITEAGLYYGAPARIISAIL